MATSTPEARRSLLDNRIHILDSTTTEASSAKHVFRSIRAILALVRDEMTASNEPVQLSDYCFDVFEAVNATIQEENTDNPSESAEIALGDLERKIERNKLEIRQILEALSTQSSSINRSDGMDGLASLGSRVTTTTRAAATAIATATATTASVSKDAFTRLIGREFTWDEVPNLIEDIFAYKDVGDKIRSLSKDSAQVFIDVMDEVLLRPDLSLWARVKCLRRLYRACGNHGLLPRASESHVSYDRASYPAYMGGYADVWKEKYSERDVAVKVIRIYTKSDLQKMIGRFCKEVITWKFLQHPNILPLIGATISEQRFEMVSDWMVNGNLNEFVEANPDANRLGLLGDIARGLIYIHNWGMVHGDLKGINILIDETVHACLADFGLLTVMWDPATLLPSTLHAPGGTLRWMSPELLDPEQFGLDVCRPTKPSDCYSLGMVIYETISGKPPFHGTSDVAIVAKVLNGGRPPREVGFMERLWKMMEQCWRPQPSDRPRVTEVLQCLEACSSGSTTPSPGVGECAKENPRSHEKGPNDNTSGSVYSNFQSTNTPPWGRDQERPLSDTYGPHYERPGITRTWSLNDNVTKKCTPHPSTTMRRSLSFETIPTARLWPPAGGLPPRQSGSHESLGRSVSGHGCNHDGDGNWACAECGRPERDRITDTTSSETERAGGRPDPPSPRFSHPQPNRDTIKSAHSLPLLLPSGTTAATLNSGDMSQVLNSSSPSSSRRRPDLHLPAYLFHNQYRPSPSPLDKHQWNPPPDSFNQINGGYQGVNISGPPPDPPHSQNQRISSGEELPGPPAGAQPLDQDSASGVKRKALCIGVNDRGQPVELGGCVDDTLNIKRFLSTTCNYKDGDIVVLTDNHGNPRQTPTARNIIDAMHWLVDDAKPGDSFFFHYSGHGCETKDSYGIQEDGFNKVIYPVDHKTTEHININPHTLLVKPLPAGCRLTTIFDFCHSGSALDLPYLYSTKGKIKELHITQESAEGSKGKLTSYAQRGAGWLLDGGIDLFRANIAGTQKVDEYIKRVRAIPDVTSWSACKDSPPSADTVETGQLTGTMSSALISVLSRGNSQSYQQVLNDARDILKSRYSQRPQLASSYPIDTSEPFTC